MSICDDVITEDFLPIFLNNVSIIFLPIHICLQVIRSVSQWSAGTSQIEDSIHNAYCSLIEKAEHFIYIEVCCILLIS